MADKKPTEIASLGEFGLIDHLTDSFSVRNASTLRGVGDDAAVIAAGADEVTLCTTDLLLEGVDFDLTYFPLKHLGYKAVVVAVSDLLAMNGRPEQLLVSLGVSSKISVEALDDLYAGIRFACEEMEVDLVGGDTKASVTGLAIHVTALGRARKEEVVYRGGAKLHDLICITGNLGAAYMGLQLLEREKRVLRGVKDPEPEFKGNEYLLQRYLKPVARKDIVELLAEEKIVPTTFRTVWRATCFKFVKPRNAEPAFTSTGSLSPVRRRLSPRRFIPIPSWRRSTAARITSCCSPCRWPCKSG